MENVSEPNWKTTNKVALSKPTRLNFSFWNFSSILNGSFSSDLSASNCKERIFRSFLKYLLDGNILKYCNLRKGMILISLRIKLLFKLIGACVVEINWFKVCFLAKIAYLRNGRRLQNGKLNNKTLKYTQCYADYNKIWELRFIFY